MERLEQLNLEYCNKAKHKETFTKEDVLAALTFYGDDVKAYPRSEIEKVSGISRPTIIKWKKIIEREQ